MLNLHDMILVLTVAQALFVALCLKLIPSSQRQSRSLLAILLILLAGQLIGNLLLWSPGFRELGIHESVAIPLLFTACVLLQGPALFFYFQALSKRLNFRHPRYGMHLLPLAIATALILLFDLTSHRFIPNGQLAGSDLIASQIVWTSIKCLPLAYVVASIVFEIRVRRYIKDLYSSIPAMENHLATIVLFGFFIIWAWSTAAHLFNPYLAYPFQDAIGLANNYMAVAIVNALVAFGLANARQAQTQSSHKPSTLAEDKYANIVSQIEKAVEEEKVYLESDINLERFAKHIGSTAKNVSYVINKHFASNFFEFINAHRIEEAKRLLACDEHRNATILEIVYLSGFNSQSAFHRFFKRLVKLTPSEYRQQQLTLKT